MQGGPLYKEVGLTKALYGYGSALRNNGTDLQPVAFSYKPPTPGALLSGVGAGQCAWPPPAGTLGVVLCNIQFAFTRPAGVLPTGMYRAFSPLRPWEQIVLIHLHVVEYLHQSTHGIPISLLSRVLGVIFPCRFDTNLTNKNPPIVDHAWPWHHL